jgi:tetratricopeptide (TPR) repeat protein
MPNYAVPASVAVATRKNNPHSGWDPRGPSSRVEPIAIPAIDAGGLTLKHGEKVFTIGSCFARNVETELMKVGFDVPVRRVLHDLGLGSEVINNFGTPSIYNEMAWALDPEAKFSYEDNFYEVVPGKFADIHMLPSMRPEPFETLVERREVLGRMYKTIPECRVIVLTLGLVETWFDKKAGIYVNATPRPVMLRNDPDRFELHVLSYNEAKYYLDATLALLKKYGHPEVQVLLSVSPVPLAETHRPMDVMIANSESKAILRAVAGAVTAENDFVHYYPSFESVTLSERKIAWMDDLVHVTRDIISLNVQRMIDTYVQDDTAEIDVADPVTAVYRAKKALEGDKDTARRFFDENNGKFSDNPSYALLYAQFLISVKEYEAALEALKPIPEDFEVTASSMVRAEALMALGKHAEAASDLGGVLMKNQTRSREAWVLAIKAYCAAGDVAGARAAVGELCRILIRQSPVAYFTLARGLKVSHPEEAAEAFINAVRTSNKSSNGFVEAAEHLLSVGRVKDARDVFARFEVNDEAPMGRVEKLRAAFAEAAE